jgi:uncharacterized protein YfcZ (UPF0381/DUF406 family)
MVLGCRGDPGFAECGGGCSDLTGDEKSVRQGDNIVNLEQQLNEKEEDALKEIQDTYRKAREVKKQEKEASVTIKDNEDKRLLASNFEKNPKFENLIASVYRGAEITILTPDTDAGYATNDTIVFSWEGEADKELTVKIIDNHEKPVYEIKLRDVNEYRWLNRLEPGLYYWMLESEEDNLGFGRFVIE